MPGPPEKPLSETPPSTEETHTARRVLLVSLSAHDEQPASEPSALVLAMTPAHEEEETSRHAGDMKAHQRLLLAELKILALAHKGAQALLPASSLHARPLPLLDAQDTARRIAQLEAENALLKEQLEDASDAPIRKHLEMGRVAEARQLVHLLLKALPSTRLEQWARVLAPPTARSDAQAGGSENLPTHEWLRAHAKEHAGQWVALREGTMLGADASRVALHRRLQQNGTLEGSLFMRL